MTNLPERSATATQRDDLLHAARVVVKQLLRDPTWGSHLDENVERIGRASEASRCHIFQKQIGASGSFELRCRAEWEAPDIPPRLAPNGDISIVLEDRNAPEWQARLSTSEVLVNLTDEFPESLNSVLSAGGVHAFAIAPITVHGEWWGCLGLEECRRERAWETRELDALCLVADAIGAAVERQRVEHQHARISSTVAHSDDAIVSEDLNGIITDWNPGAERLYGYSADEVVGQTVKFLMPDDRQAEFDQTMDRLRRGERISHFETRRVRKDGSEISVSVSITPVYDCAGKLAGATSIARDITDREQAELTLRASEERLRLALDAGDTGAWEWYVESGQMVWAPTMELLHGIEPGSFGGTMADSLGLVHPEDRERVRRLIGQAVDRGEYRVEYRISPAGGETRWLELRGQLIRDDRNHPVGMTGICYDITERKAAQLLQADLLAHAERAHTEADAERNRLNELFQHAPALMALLQGPDHVFILANDHFLATVGYRELIGKTVRDAFPELEGQGIIELLDHAYQTGETIVRAERPIELDPGPDGMAEVHYFSFAYQPVRDSDGGVTGVLVHAVDLTEHVKARQRIEELATVAAEERDRLQQIIDVMPEGISITDEHGVFVLTNSAAHRIWGRPAPNGDYQSYSVFECYQPDGMPIVIEDLPLSRSLLRDETVLGEQLLIRNEQSRELVPVLVNSTPLRDSAGKVRGAVAIFQDISQIKEFELQKDEFLQTVSHDLKNPLSAIQGYSQILRRLPANDHERVAMAIGHMETATQRAIDLLDEILDLTRFQMGRPLALTRTRADLLQLARRLVDQHQATTELHRVRIVSHVTALVGEWDVVRLERVLGNLLSNAILYSPRGGQITLTVDRAGSDAGGVAVVSVEDQGIGVPAADLPHVFERFRRGSNVQDRIRGTGLGLAGAKAIVDAHGGEITVESVEGQGSTFTVRLPLMFMELEANR